MKILQLKEWLGKTNFVDDANMVVGFDTDQCCCESFGWFITRTEPLVATTDEPKDEPDESEFEPYRFDPAWFKDLPTTDKMEGGGSVAFKLVCDGKPDLFLVLYNFHNGYYAHGFTVEVGGIKTREDSL